MTFKTGSITSATPAKALFDLLDPDFVAVGYVRVETALASGGVTWNVYRSPAAGNFFGSDWYFALGYDTAASSTLYSCIFEDWDATNKLAVRFAPSTTGLVPGTGYVNPQAASALPAGFTLSHLLPTTAFTYASSALIDRLAIGAWTAASTARFGWYVGLYDSFYSTADDPFPLVICTIGVNGGHSGGLGLTSRGASPREPMTTLANTPNFFVTQGSGLVTNGEHRWNPSTLNAYQNRPWVSRVLVNGRGGAWSGDGSIRYSYPRGLFRDLFAGPQSSAYQNNADRITWTTSAGSYAGVIFRQTTDPAPILIPEY